MYAIRSYYALQTLVENAIKHNEMSMANPLKIVIAISDDYELLVENNLQQKRTLDASSGTGLKNLAGRYEYLTGKEMMITKNHGYFRITSYNVCYTKLLRVYLPKTADFWA